MSETALEFVSDFDVADEPYQFDIVRVMFDDARGAYRIGRDSGCSCPSPFEDFTSDADWGPTLTASEARQEVLSTHVAYDCHDGKRRCAEAIVDHAKSRNLW